MGLAHALNARTNGAIQTRLHSINSLLRIFSTHEMWDNVRPCETLLTSFLTHRNGHMLWEETANMTQQTISSVADVHVRSSFVTWYIFFDFITESITIGYQGHSKHFFKWSISLFPPLFFQIFRYFIYTFQIILKVSSKLTAQSIIITLLHLHIHSIKNTWQVY